MTTIVAAFAEMARESVVVAAALRLFVCVVCEAREREREREFSMGRLGGIVV